jgi:protein-tyrosine phosphatase
VPLDEPARVVVLCHANVARSVVAALLLRGATDERGIALELRTAGTHATEGQPVSARTVAAMTKVTGSPVSLGAHRAHLLSSADVEWSDLIIAMEDSQVRFVRRMYPEAADRVATLAVLSHELPDDKRSLLERVMSLGLEARDGSADGDIEDPAGGDDGAYERATTALIARCGELARRLNG